MTEPSSLLACNDEARTWSCQTLPPGDQALQVNASNSVLRCYLGMARHKGSQSFELLISGYVGLATWTQVLSSLKQPLLALESFDQAELVMIHIGSWTFEWQKGAHKIGPPWSSMVIHGHPSIPSYPTISHFISDRMKSPVDGVGQHSLCCAPRQHKQSHKMAWRALSRLWYFSLSSDACTSTTVLCAKKMSKASKVLELVWNDVPKLFLP